MNPDCLTHHNSTGPRAVTGFSRGPHVTTQRSDLEMKRPQLEVYSQFRATGDLKLNTSQLMVDCHEHHRDLELKTIQLEVNTSSSRGKGNLELNSFQLEVAH
ncbi:hypothetical protein PGT21_026554 [Puccinia graminis f. sp. tritici]|uniref:Uncharacterized protein n=1 Tax=Puccinia graminis f. sp. tritici TaxID=56615 RepID=A0A5B0LPI7_PUCGR|nr:hypothetical protein PGT21_000737 [Puccinia graminis f. sp. tritici]KAA1073824.1 hypothetical protein PGT21_026554 [Puccinia graminis f. sp. tritici]